jgi:hypothetical protein
MTFTVLPIPLDMIKGFFYLEVRAIRRERACRMYQVELAPYGLDSKGYNDPAMWEYYSQHASNTTTPAK